MARRRLQPAARRKVHPYYDDFSTPATTASTR
jgi:hypothetical protein